MARVQIDDLVLGRAAGGLSSLAGAVVGVYAAASTSITVDQVAAWQVAHGTLASVYAGPTGTGQVTNPQSVDPYGRFTGWVDSGVDYDMVVSLGPLALGFKRLSLSITGGGGSPTGAAGGVLAGTYPAPAFAVDMATQAELDAAIAGVSGGGGPDLLTNRYAHVYSSADDGVGDFTVVSPVETTIFQGTFTPSQTSAVVELDLIANHYEASTGHAQVCILYTQSASFPLNTRLTNPDGSPNIKAGVTRLDVGGVGGTPGSLHFAKKLTGLTAGTAVRYEVTAGILGYQQFISLPEASVRIAASATQIVRAGHRFGDVIVVGVGATKAMVCRLNHYLGAPVDDLLGSVTLPVAASTSRSVAVTPNGLKAVCGNIEGSLSVIDTLGLTKVDVASPSGQTAPYAVAITPDGLKAWVAFANNFSSNSTVIPLTLATNTWGTAVAIGPLPAGMAITPDGTKLLVTTANGVSIVTLSGTPAVAATLAIAGGGASDVAVAPNSAMAYAVVANTIYPITLSTNTLGAGVAIGASGANVMSGAQVMSDGRTLMTSNAHAAPNIGNAVINLPTPVAAAWFPTGTDLGGSGLTFGGLAVTDRGSIIYQSNVSGDPHLNIYYGGQFNVRTVNLGGTPFWGERAQLTAYPAA